MRKERIKGFAAGILVMVILSATLVFASPGVMREIQHGISVVLNGRMVQFDEDSQPFMMDGRTFLPLRAMSDLLGLPVEFDAETNTAYVGYADVAELLVGTWETERAGDTSWNDRIELYADGTGRMLQFQAITIDQIPVRNERYFTWSIDGNMITLLHDKESGWYQKFRFAIFRDVFGSDEVLLLSEQLTDWINGHPGSVVTFKRTEPERTAQVPGDLPYTIFGDRGNRFYVVQTGDTLWNIAVRIYGDGERFADI